MEWEAEAKAAIDRAPFFVRRMARRKVEELVRADGRRVVTLADVRRARDEAAPLQADVGSSPALSISEPGSTPAAPPEGQGDPPATRIDGAILPSSTGDGGSGPPPAESTALFPAQAADGDRVEPESGLTEAQIRLIERLVDQIPGQETRYWSAKGCGGAVGCPLTVVDVRAASDAVVAAVERSGLAEVQAARLRGPVLSHHRFRAAVAGCPNSCSEPQIKDFALVARARPILGPGDCVECGACEAACKEDAVRVVDGVPTFDLSRCVGCGGCAEACESEAIGRVVGYDVLVGGRLGRHPRLATVVAEGVSLEEGVDVLDACLSLLVHEGRPGERLGALLDRIGIERIGA